MSQLDVRNIGIPVDTGGVDGLEQVNGRPGVVDVQPPAVEEARGLRPPAEVRADAVRDAGPMNNELRGAAHPERESVWSRIGRWFREGSLHRAGLPEVVTAQMPDGSPVNFSGDSLASMIKSLPRLDRAEARAGLPGLLEARMRHGHELLGNILAGQVLDAPSISDVSDIMLYIDARAHSTGNVFEAGSYSIEDPQGRLAAYLNRCPEKYFRSSSHLNAMQSVDLPEGHTNTHRGIDLPSGRNGALYGHATVLFGVIPGENGSPRRLFLKAESHGCRLNTLSQADKSAGSDGVAERPWRASDIGNMFSHGLSFIATRGKGSVAGSRKERIPDSVQTAYKALLENVKGDAYLTAALGRGRPLDKSSGIHVMLDNMRDVLIDPGGKSREELVELFQPVRQAMGRLTDASHLDVRIGNEMVFSSAELLGTVQMHAADVQAVDRYLGIVD